MEHAAGPSAALTISLALAIGMIVQALARHLRIPGIVGLLAAGVLFGPDGLGVLQPASLGATMQGIVGFAVAVILFEGGLNLKVSRLRKQGVMVRRLITLGALITLLGGALVARLVLEWDWRRAVLFGALVIVTGPTVITPLLRRVKVRQSLQTILEAEGVLIDAVGAITAVVVLEIVIHPTVDGTTESLTGFALRFGLGIALGLAVGFLAAGALRVRRLVPEGLENVFVLSLVLATFQIGDWFIPETGIVAVTAAGLVLGNMKTHVARELAEFKEQLTVMLIGLLFVLLAADVRIDDVVALGWPGIFTVLALMFVVRPLGVAACGVGAGLSHRERLFLGWVAPRGIVAAAVASLFAGALQNAGLEGGTELRALVFLVIAVTVVVQGLTMGPVARLLGVGRAGNVGYVILGANGLGLALANGLRSAGQPCVLIEANPERANRAQDEGHKVIYGNGLQHSVQRRAQPEIRAGAIATTPNEEANLLFAQRMLDEHACPKAWVGVDRLVGHLDERFVRDERVHVLFGHARDLDVWATRLQRGRARVECWLHEDRVDPGVDDADRPRMWGEVPGGNDNLDAASPGTRPPREPVLPLLLRRGDAILPVDETMLFEPGDTLWIAVETKREQEAAELMISRGWTRASDEAA